MWDGNEVWLVAAGGALFFAFPRLYASAFSGFYLSLMIVLWLLILRGISIELRDHVDNPLWRGLWGTVFGIASGILALVFGIALGNVVRGVPLDQSGYFFLPLWIDFSATGHAGIVDWYTLLIGAASFTAFGDARQLVGGAQNRELHATADTSVRRSMLGGFTRTDVVDFGCELLDPIAHYQTVSKRAMGARVPTAGDRWPDMGPGF